MDNEVLAFYKEEVERMEKQGYTPEQIEREFDRLINLQNMVTMAVL